jgi:CHASE2 domain-containing sensor protein
MAPESLRERLEATMWARHENPWSGWTRVPAGPALMLAIYLRSKRLLALVLGWVVVNPFVFPPPDPETESWMTRGVRAERWWLEAGRGTMGWGWPNGINLAGAAASLVGVVAALRRRPRETAVATLLASVLKLAWMEAIARQYDRRGDAADEGRNCTD